MGESVVQGRQAGRGAVIAAIVALLAALGALGLGAATAGAQSAVLGQWRFDEGAGQAAVDDGPFALDGRLGLTTGVDVNDPTRIPGVSGGALHFDGASFVRLPNAPELEPTAMTLEAVVRAPSSPGQFRYVVSHGAQGCVAGSYGLYTGQHGGIAFYIFDGHDFKLTPAIGPDGIWNGAWHHVAGTFDGRTMRLFVDGHPVGEPVAVAASIAYALTSSDHYIGTYQGTCSLPLRGDVDLIRMWDGPLAPDYIGSLADAALTAPVSTIAPPRTPAPESVPVADAAQSQGDAPASRSTLTPIAPGSSYSATAQQLARPGTAATPGAPARACVVRPSAKRVRAGRRTTFTVHVALRGKPLKAVRVVATEARTKRRLASGKTARDGRARLKVKPSRRGSLTLKVLGRTDCRATALTILKAAARG
jgi:hypothetical protein